MNYTIQRVNAPPPLTADWEAPGWSAASTGRIEAYHPKSTRHRPRTEFRLLADDSALYLQFRVHDRYVRCVHTEFNSNVCKDSCVEFFVRPGTSGPYFNFEFNAGGMLLASCMRDWRRLANGFGDCRRFTHEQCAAIRVATTLPGVIDPEITEPCTWVLATHIPLALMREDLPMLSTAPGTVWQANFYKCASDCSHPHWGSWSPLAETLNFHLPQFFGTLTFADAPRSNA